VGEAGTVIGDVDYRCVFAWRFVIDTCARPEIRSQDVGEAALGSNDDVALDPLTCRPEVL
jgi:hypothetical protein